MRWFVDVSVVAKASPPDRYCLEADRWEDAIQRVWVLRREKTSGSLRFYPRSSAWRAVDVERGVEYLATRAPDDANVTTFAPSTPRESSAAPVATQSNPRLREPTYTVVRVREEEPTPQSPLTYRERTYAVASDTP